jgi:hypothetical protein
MSDFSLGGRGEVSVAQRLHNAGKVASVWLEFEDSQAFFGGVLIGPFTHSSHISISHVPSCETSSQACLLFFTRLRIPLISLIQINVTSYVLPESGDLASHGVEIATHFRTTGM